MRNVRVVAMPRGQGPDPIGSLLSITKEEGRMRRVVVVVVALIIGVVTAAVAVAASPGADVRLTNDAPGTGGYTSDYTLVTGQPYTDATLSECSRSRGRQNEPADVIDPRNS